jgi:YbgC/YbaW family acyl-CoA thioester hydrolase
VAFERELVVRFDEIDRAGIVYFADVQKYCHVVYEALMTEVVGDLEAFFAGSGWGMPLVHAEADYARPNRLGETLSVALEVERLGAKSITFAYTVRCQGEDRAKVKLVHAFVDMERFAPISAPDAFRAGLRRLGLIGEESARVD